MQSSSIAPLALLLAARPLTVSVPCLVACAGTRPLKTRSPGYGLSLVAETTTGALLSADCVARPGELPEDLGMTAVLLILV